MHKKALFLTALGLLLGIGSVFSSSTADRPQKPPPQTNIFPEPFRVKPLGTYRLGPAEQLHDIILDLRDNSYTLISQKQNPQEYYVRQGNKTLGPFNQYHRAYTWYVRDYPASGAWYTENTALHQFFIGSAKTIYGPIADPEIYALQYVQMEDRFLSYTADIGMDDKKDFAYILEEGAWQALPHQDISDVHIAPVTGKIAYSYRFNGESYVFLDGETRGPFYYVTGIGWSADGERYAYAYGESQVSGSWDHRFQDLVYGENHIAAETAFQHLAFSPEGAMLLFIDGDALGIIPAQGSLRRIPSEQGSIYTYRVSKNNEMIAYSCGSADSSEQYVVLCYPDNKTTQYGPFIPGTVSYNFSPNGKNFYCKGNKPGSSRQVIYLEDKEYVINDPSPDRISPLFTAQENRYAGLYEDKNGAFIADIDSDISFQGNILYTENMNVIVAHDMEQIILPDGTPVYWTQQQNQKYLHIFSDQYGPFDYVHDYSDGVFIRWIICYRGTIQLITLER